MYTLLTNAHFSSTVSESQHRRFFLFLVFFFRTKDFFSFLYSFDPCQLGLTVQPLGSEALRSLLHAAHCDIVFDLFPFIITVARLRDETIAQHLH